jgi:hypothetical protein
MNVATGTVATQFHSWENLFRIFGITSLQCDDGDWWWHASQLYNEIFNIAEVLKW